MVERGHSVNLYAPSIFFRCGSIPPKPMTTSPSTQIGYLKVCFLKPSAIVLHWSPMDGGLGLYSVKAGLLPHTSASSLSWPTAPSSTTACTSMLCTGQWCRGCGVWQTCQAAPIMMNVSFTSFLSTRIRTWTLRLYRSEPELQFLLITRVVSKCCWILVAESSWIWTKSSWIGADPAGAGCSSRIWGIVHCIFSYYRSRPVLYFVNLREDSVQIFYGDIWCLLYKTIFLKNIKTDWMRCLFSFHLEFLGWNHIKYYLFKKSQVLILFKKKFKPTPPPPFR